MTDSVPRHGPWWGTEDHRSYLLRDALRQFRFFARSLDVAGGFHAQDFDGAPIPDAPRELHATTRMVHAFALGHLAGVKGADDMIDHGMASLWRHHRDGLHGGYVWAFAPGGATTDASKLAYGHAFVLLAGASAKAAGHPDADRLIEDVWEIINVHFWDHDHARMREEYTRDWAEFSAYRGMNANMHSVEALLAASEATGDRSFAARARMILDFFAGHVAPRHEWRLPEHYNRDWHVDPAYEGNPMFRPAGTTPGHSLELSRLLLQAWDMDGRRDPALLRWSEKLYARALSDGWDSTHGGILYTVDTHGRPLRRARYWWPVAEAIGAAAAQLKRQPDEALQEDYLRLWRCAEDLFIDRRRGGWFPEVGADNRPDARQFTGKPDIYHAIQACLFPLLPGLSGAATELPSLAREIAALQG